MNPAIVVVGSANLDLVYSVERIPQPGETLLATGASQHPGGKGNNQVIAVARAGAPVAFVAAMGTDEAASVLRAALDDAGAVMMVRETAAVTGTALITVDASAENTIVVNSGANAMLVELTASELAAIEAADYLLMQLETPLETVLAASRAARAAGTTVVLNAAPARELPAELVELVDILIVNEHEALLVASGIEAAGPLPPSVNVNNAAAVGEKLRSAIPAIVITLGGDGAMVVDSNGASHVPARKVEPLDTTGAGDTLCGALVAALSEGMTLVDATAFASAAAALSVQRKGAVPSIPVRAEIDAFLR